MLITFIIFAVFALFIFNSLTDALCIKKNIPEERQPKVFQTINILLTILLLSGYLNIWTQI
ncbi:hypothetical protein EV207_11181 [Scopulibacillus darangshiensis]|uniref:Uncharacterized protein n=1 Tax=Scopulibacillus darangshiensis TaxID=442528 RepID=A0A4R2P3C0_9BACL|nr:hypothetical protein [Scopulibacillus darangshiensis]TCP29279.1 hypothetical protein EV207_11181 [Scopulibacillus darangshiensis]